MVSKWEKSTIENLSVNQHLFYLKMYPKYVLSPFTSSPCYLIKLDIIISSSGYREDLKSTFISIFRTSQGQSIAIFTDASIICDGRNSAAWLCSLYVISDLAELINIGMHNLWPIY